MFVCISHFMDACTCTYLNIATDQEWMFDLYMYIAHYSTFQWVYNFPLKLIVSFQAPNNEVFYELTGSTSGLEYFGINKNTGEIYAKKNLYLDQDDTPLYKVSYFNTLYSFVEGPIIIGIERLGFP